MSEGRGSQIEEEDALALALEYYLYAGIRTPEHLKSFLHGGEHTPWEMIDKVTGGGLDEADYDPLKHNIRANLENGEADRVKADIEEFIRTFGLEIYKLNHPETRPLLIGSYGAVNIKVDIN